ncbi:MAG: YbgC/FadM family acyl-CoA thioesterase [Candidatus Omnitrophica bacterium]|nr:YbgC/FadM family acyl-CoA thioesterase [Candidatus Omnitrophota bacterium]
MMHAINKKIYYHDTDCGGVVYYANYLKYFEEARTEYLADRGINLIEMAKEGFLFVVKKVDIEYKSPGRYGDKLTVTSEITKLRSASMQFTQEVKRGDLLIVAAKTVLVCIDKTFHPTAMSDDLIEKIK